VPGSRKVTWAANAGLKCALSPRLLSSVRAALCGEHHTTFRVRQLRDVKFHFRFARSAVIANPLVLQVIHRYKYNHALCFEPFLADLLIRQAVPSLKNENGT